MNTYSIPDKLMKIMNDDCECSVVEQREQTMWFEITTGIKQGCVMSGFLILITVDWIMRRTKGRHRNGIGWNLTGMLEDLAFADDIVLVSSKYEHIQNKTNRQEDNAQRVGLKLNVQKWKVMRHTKRTQSNDRKRGNRRRRRVCTQRTTKNTRT